MADKDSLVKDIKGFLSVHGKRSADEPTEWNSPDGALMEHAALELEQHGFITRLPHSSWESGGYQPYTCGPSRELHDSLILRLKDFLKKDK